MPQLSYTIGYIDLRKSLENIFKGIRCRTEIRKAQKSDVRVTLQPLGERRNEEVIKACQTLLRQLLREERIPYDESFDILIQDSTNYLFVARKDMCIVSFVVVTPATSNNFFARTKTAFLSLSATNRKYRVLCPNYLVIWDVINFLKSENFDYFNLGLLQFIGCPDSSLDRVSFFKKKWNVIERKEQSEASLQKFLYYRYLKRFWFIRELVYRVKFYRIKARTFLYG